jgi:RNA polymerase sigma-70 factor, ECF subfamily
MVDPADRVYFRLLVIRCQAGDNVAFEELVARCHRGLRGFLSKMLSNQHNVDDVAQDVWMEVFRSLKNLNDPDAFRAWLYRAARNRAYGLLRRERKPIGSIDDIDSIFQEEEPDFSVADAAAVHQALGQLGPEPQLRGNRGGGRM